MKISFIIPVYNSALFLKKCLDSITNNNENLEIIIINDGSTDNSLDIINQYKDDTRIIIVNNKKNMGVSYARNKGISIASGDYIAFLDSDDYLEKNYFDKIRAYLNKDNDIILFNYYKEKNGKKVKIDSFYNYDNLDTKYLLSHSVLWNKIYKKGLLKQNDFPINYVYEDTFLAPTLLLRTKKIVFVNEYLYSYVSNSNSITNKNYYLEDNLHSLDNLYHKLYKKYYDEVEYLFIYNLLISTLLNEKEKNAKYDLKKINNYVKDKFPKYYQNIYWSKKGLLKKIYLYLVYRNCFFIVRMMTKLV